MEKVQPGLSYVEKYTTGSWLLSVKTTSLPRRRSKHRRRLQYFSYDGLSYVSLDLFETLLLSDHGKVLKAVLETLAKTSTLASN